MFVSTYITKWKALIIYCVHWTIVIYYTYRLLDWIFFLLCLNTSKNSAVCIVENIYTSFLSGHFIVNKLLEQKDFPLFNRSSIFGIPSLCDPICICNVFISRYIMRDKNISYLHKMNRPFLNKILERIMHYYKYYKYYYRFSNIFVFGICNNTRSSVNNYILYISLQLQRINYFEPFFLKEYIV